MPKLKRIALFGLGDTVHMNQMLGLQSGFREIGVECFAVWPLPTPAQMENFVDNWRPDAIFEWDRSRNWLGSLPGHIKHAVWVQNPQSYGFVWSKNFGGSDLVYANYDPARLGFDSIGPDDFQWLYPAVDDLVFTEVAAQQPVYDMIFAGYIAAPINAADLAKTIVVNNQPTCTLGHLVDSFLKTGLRNWNMDVAAIQSFILNSLRHYVPAVKIEDLSNDLIFFFAEHLVRLLDRKQVADAIVATSSNIAFFGPDGWAQWPQFAKFYQRNIEKPRELADAYRSALLNVHNSQVSMHHRTFEVMGCGRALLINRNVGDDTASGITNFFEPDEDFIWYEMDDLAETAKRALGDRPALERIGRNAAKRVRDGHTWRHRAEQIARDIDAL